MFVDAEAGESFSIRLINCAGRGSIGLCGFVEIIVDYSKQHGVGVFFWRHTRSLRTPEARDEFFKMLHDIGAAGAKVDFLDHEHKEVVELYAQLLAKAAEYKLTLIFHGANKPTGRARTWPNDMVHEAVRGLESSRLVERARHQTILPFTRCLAGPADYTAMIFNQRRGDTTAANQIASLAIFDSPLLTIAANPQTILTNPALDVIKSIPPVWDETIVLPGSEIEELAAYARRSGTTWFVAVMCGPEQKTIEIPFWFLKAGQYKAVFVTDDDGDGSSVELNHKTVNAGDSITLKLRKGGGFIARFTRQ